MLGWQIAGVLLSTALVSGFAVIAGLLLHAIAARFWVLVPLVALLLALHTILLAALSFLLVAIHCLLILRLYRERNRAIDAVVEECRGRGPNQRPVRCVTHKSKILFAGNAVPEPGDHRDVTVRLLDGGQRTDAHAPEVRHYGSTRAEGWIQRAGMSADRLGLRKVDTER